MKRFLLTLLLYQNKFSFYTEIRLIAQILIKQDYNEENLSVTRPNLDYANLQLIRAEK